MTGEPTAQQRTVAVDKSPDAFRTISEVASDLDLPQHVLRFWETRFSQIRPLKRGGGRRYYRPDDVELLRGIRHLLYGEGYTIKGVQRILREQGVKFVMQSWRDGVPVAGGMDGQAAAPSKAPPKPPKPAPAEADANGRPEAPENPAAAAAKGAGRQTDDTPASGGYEIPDEPIPRDLRVGDSPEKGGEAGRRPFRIIDKLRGDRADEEVGDGRLSRDDVRRLQATLFELLEIKRLLDQAR